MTWVLVTGATAGMGRAFAEHLAARGHHVVLVARDAHRLNGVARQLEERFGVLTETLVADLTDRAALDVVAQRVASIERPVDVLVNNAGFGPNQRFVTGDLAREEEVIDLMMRAVVVLSHAASRAMTSRGRGQIINVSSVAAWLPVGTYGAAKGYVIAFTQGLALELAGTGVSATVACPGYTRTEFHSRAGIDPSGIPAWAWLDVDTVIEQTLRDAERGRVVSITGVRYRVAVAALRVLPASVLRRIALHRPGSPR